MDAEEELLEAAQRASQQSHNANAATTSSGGAALVKVSWCKFSHGWAHAFEAEKKVIQGTLAVGETLVIEHIGSTSVPGIGGKPYVDIALQRPLPESLTLAACGYTLSSPGANWFVKSAHHPTKEIQGFIVHVLDGYHFKRCLVFRDYLRENPQVPSPRP